jgi:hypothetical protein
MEFPRTALLIVGLAGCAGESYYLDLPDIDLEPPRDLEERRAAYRSGSEAWHGDACAVADQALRRHLDLPWKADPYRPGAYEERESVDWGRFVVRSYTYPSGGVMRYRVKVRPYHEIWYPVQISRFKRVELEEGHEH